MKSLPFTVEIRWTPGDSPVVDVRFVATSGQGELHVGQPNPPMATDIGILEDVSPRTLKTGRFVYVEPEYHKRLSYSFARLITERLRLLPPEEWTALTPTTELGLRYLEVTNPAPAVASVRLPVSATTPVPRARANQSRQTDKPTQPIQVAPRTSAPIRVPEPEKLQARSAVPRGMAIERGLGQQAIGQLSEAELRTQLAREMAKVEELHIALATAKKDLTESQAREADLIALLKRWSNRGR